MCEVTRHSISGAVKRERRTTDDLALDPHHYHRCRAILGRMGHLSRKEIGFLSHGSVTSYSWEDRAGIGSGLSSCVLLARSRVNDRLWTDQADGERDGATGDGLDCAGSSE